MDYSVGRIENGKVGVKGKMGKIGKITGSPDRVVTAIAVNDRA